MGNDNIVINRGLAEVSILWEVTAWINRLHGYVQSRCLVVDLTREYHVLVPPQHYIIVSSMWSELCLYENTRGVTTAGPITTSMFQIVFKGYCCWLGNLSKYFNISLHLVFISWKFLDCIKHRHRELQHYEKKK